MSDPTMLDCQATLAFDAQAEIGEGPVWHATEQALYWIDIMGGRLHRFDPRDARDSFLEVGQPLGAAVPRTAGGFVLALGDGFGLIEAGTRKVRLVAAVEADLPGNRMNDGKCDVNGAFWAGTMPIDEASATGTVYRFSQAGQVEAVLSGVTISNGIDWSLDGRTMYYIDTATQAVDAFDFDAATGSIANRRHLITSADSDGSPDGMTVDAAGYLWVAYWNGWAVRRYAPDGKLAGTVHVPASQVTSCAFGGPDLQDLFITSARRGLTNEQLAAQPAAGGIFMVRPGIAGRQPYFYGG